MDSEIGGYDRSPAQASPQLRAVDEMLESLGSRYRSTGPTLSAVAASNSSSTTQLFPPAEEESARRFEEDRLFGGSLLGHQSPPCPHPGGASASAARNPLPLSPKASLRARLQDSIKAKPSMTLSPNRTSPTKKKTDADAMWQKAREDSWNRTQETFFGTTRRTGSPTKQSSEGRQPLYSSFADLRQAVNKREAATRNSLSGSTEPLSKSQNIFFGSEKIIQSFDTKEDESPLSGRNRDRYSNMWDRLHTDMRSEKSVRSDKSPEERMIARLTLSTNTPGKEGLQELFDLERKTLRAAKGESDSILQSRVGSPNPLDRSRGTLPPQDDKNLQSSVKSNSHYIELIDRNLERRLQETERQTQLLSDRTQFLTETTEEFKKSIANESIKREESMRDLVNVRNQVQEKIEQELDTFRLLANEKMHEMLQAQEMIHDLEKKIQKDADTEMRTAMSFIKDRQESNDNWSIEIKRDLSDHIKKMSCCLHDRINESIAQVDAQAVELTNQIKQTINEQETINKDNNDQFNRLNENLLKEHQQQYKDVEHIKSLLEEVRLEQNRIDVRTDEKLKETGAAIPQMHEETMRKVDEIQVEWLNTLCSVEEAFHVQQGKVIEDNNSLQQELKDVFMDLKDDLLGKKLELDSMNNEVNTNHSLFHEALGQTSEVITRRLQKMDEQCTQTVDTLNKEKDHRFANILDQLSEQRSLHEKISLDTKKQIDDFKNVLSNTRFEQDSNREKRHKEEMELQDAIRDCRSVMIREAEHESEMLTSLREQHQANRLIANETFASIQGKHGLFDNRLDDLENAVTKEQTARIADVEQLERGVQEIVTTQHDLHEFELHVKKQMEKTDAMMAVILQGLEDVHKRVAKVMGNVGEMKQNTRLSKEDLQEYKQAGALKAMELQTLRDGLARLEEKLLTSPALERVLNPNSSPQFSKARAILGLNPRRKTEKSQTPTLVCK